MLFLALGASAAPPEPEAIVGRDSVTITIEALEAAENTVDVVVYKFTEETLLAAVDRAVTRGVRVRILADTPESSSDESLLGAAILAGARVRAWDPKRGKLHAKFAVFDGRRVLAGSFNWTRSAARSNVELLISFREPNSVDRFAALFEGLWKKGRGLRR